MTEFFHTVTSPGGHGFTEANLEKDTAYYTFRPKADIPLKVIVFDDTCKANPAPLSSSYYAAGCVDQERYDWLAGELEKGEAEGELMIVAAHIPVGPQKDLYNPAPATLFYARPATATTPAAGIPPYNIKSDAELIAKLHQYPNLLMWISGHAHRNVVTPQPSPDPARPELGFWEVETPSLRDFPQELRTFDIRRNADDTVSILVTGVDPAVAARLARGEVAGVCDRSGADFRRPRYVRRYEFAGVQRRTHQDAEPRDANEDRERGNRRLRRCDHWRVEHRQRCARISERFVGYGIRDEALGDDPRLAGFRSRGQAPAHQPGWGERHD